jgi:hypothetical protein
MLNFNVHPYYDDFNEDKNFHRILFKPGVAVQARELTQAQTILQDQIGKLGKFVLSDGSNVTGGKYSIDTNVRSLNIANVGTIADDILNFDGMVVVGENSLSVSLIVSVDILNFYLVVKPITNAVSKYQSGETLLIFSTKELAYDYLTNNLIQPDYTATLFTEPTPFSVSLSGTRYSTILTGVPVSVKVGDTLSANYNTATQTDYIVTEKLADTNGSVIVNRQLTEDYVSKTFTVLQYASKTVQEVSFSEGVYFTNNTFVKALPQSIVPNSATQYPSCVVGYEVVETILDYVDDPSLLDPAQGSYNYTAPGSDRYKIYLNLVSKPLVYGTIEQSSLTTAKFIELLRLKNGVIVSDNTSPVLGGLQEILAKQMYDHAGNFIISPFTISFNNSDFRNNETMLNCSVAAGRAYVYGYPYNATFPTNLTNITKARETASESNVITNTNYGNFIKVKSLSGGLPYPKLGTKVEFFANTKTQISDAGKLGFGYIRNMDFIDTDNYGLYLYDSSISQKEMLKIKSVKAVGGFLANTILSTTGTTEVQDTNSNKLLFKLKYSNPASLSNVLVTLDSFVQDLQVTTNKAYIITDSPTINFATGTSTDLSLELKNQNYIVVAKTAVDGYTVGQYIDLSHVKIKIEDITTGYKTTIEFLTGYEYSGKIDVKYSLSYTNATKKQKTLVQNKVAQVTAKTVPTNIGYADVVKFKGIFAASTPVTSFSSSAWNSSTSYTKGTVVPFSEKLYIAVSDNTGQDPSRGSSYWNQLNDVTKQYKTDNGQREYMYDHATITAQTSNFAKTVFVLFDYFTHSENGQYIAFDSYSMDYKDIPVVKINNISYELKNYIDFRPRKKDITNNVITGEFNSYNIPSSITNSSLKYNMTYYMGRIDKLILSHDRKLQWLTGKSSYRNYIPPRDLPDAMTIATIQFDPFTPDLKSIKINYEKHRRYTMDDIGGLEERIQNVEYYTALTIGEKSALSTNIIDQYGTRLKNGFIVDSFTNFTICDIQNRNNTFSIDLDKNEATASFKDKTFNLTTSVSSSGLLDLRRNKLVGFTYEQVPLVTQTAATSYIKINQFNAISYLGSMELDPQKDIYTDVVSTVNKIDENTTAFMNASEIPGILLDSTGLLRQETSKIYSVTDNSQPATKVNINNDTYTITASTKKLREDTAEVALTTNIHPTTRSIHINFLASGLAPLTKMFVYVNGQMVNAYVTPHENPKGAITTLNILDKGAGYGACTSPTLVISNDTSNNPATFKLTTDSGSIKTASIVNFGSDYSTMNTIISSVSSSVVPTANADVQVSTVPVQGSYLYSNRSGICGGTLDLPNGLISFQKGELVIAISDTPHGDLQNSLAYAHATFYSSTKYVEKTIFSIREPVISKAVGTIQPPLPSSGKRICVPASLQYLIYHYGKTYASDVQNGTLKIPVYLSALPTSDVTVRFLPNASEDKSQASAITSYSPTTLTFTGSNWNAPQEVSIAYNLGTRKEYTDRNNVKQYLDNNLPSYVEFYSESADPAYNHPDTALPFRSWLLPSPVIGVSSVHLSPYKVYDPKAGPSAATSPFVDITTIDQAFPVVGGEGFITVTYGGGNDIGWWSQTANNPYPLTFSFTTDSSPAKVEAIRSEYTDVDSNVVKSGPILIVNKPDHQVLSFKFYVRGLVEGTTNITVSTISAYAPWNGLSKTVSVTVGAALTTATPDIVVHNNVIASTKEGLQVSAPRVTNSKGGTNIIGVTLSTQPASAVSIKANSSIILNGGNIYNVSNNGVELVSGNTISFSTSDWNQMKSIVVTGTNDPTNFDKQNTIPYNVYLKATSSDGNYNNKTKSVELTNIDYIDIAGEVKVSYVSKNNAKLITSKETKVVTLQFILSRKLNFGQVVKVFVTSGNTTEGGNVLFGGSVATSVTLTFTYGTEFIPQFVQVQGIDIEGSTEGDINYKINYESQEWNTVTNAKLVPSEWNGTGSIDATNHKYGTPTTIKEVYNDFSTRTVTAAPLIGPGKIREVSRWAPDFTVSSATIKVVKTGKAENPKAQIISVDSGSSTSPGSIKLQVSANLTSASYGSDTKRYKQGNTTVRVELTRGSNADCFFSKHTDITYETKPKDDPNHGETYYGTIQSITKDKAIFDIYLHGGAGSSTKKVPVMSTYNIKGVYLDPTPGFKITDTIEQYTEVRTFRTDNYVQQGEVLKTTEILDQSFEYIPSKTTTDDFHRKAVYDAVHMVVNGKSYPVSPYPDDIESTYTSYSPTQADVTRKQELRDYYTKQITTITEFKSKIDTKNSKTSPDPLLAAASAYQQDLINSFQAKINSIV